jgi:hypothetical protein
MNLEPEISPASIKANQWEWMKRYRVWEANRKIFLYPENLLHPELRDNKSSFFRDLEGELLQADITDELAETALLNYLEKLDDISKVDICAIYLQENELGNKFDDILHVFGRTIGASQKYYYRRFEYGYWTPWEKVDLDIEGNPISPIVWKNRLFLFWLSIVRKGSDGKPLPNENKSSPAQLTIEDLNNAGKESIEINLSWSEYYNNKWQPRKTSDFDNPIKLSNIQRDAFKRENIIASTFLDRSGVGVYVGVPNLSYNYFKLYNKHSTPLIDSGLDSSDLALLPIEFRYFADFQSKLSIGYASPSSSRNFNNEILRKTSNAFSIVEFSHIFDYSHPVDYLFEAPFFYRDGKHVFFVEPDENFVIVIPDFNFYGGYIPDMVVKEDPIFPNINVRPRVGLRDSGIPEEISEERNRVIKSVVDPMEIDLSDKSFFPDKVVSDNRLVTFGDAKIGPLGSSDIYTPYDKGLKKGGFRVVNNRGI